MSTGRLTTHVLDTAQGKPAAGLTIACVRLTDAGEAPVKTVTTNADGRIDTPLLKGAALAVGTFELRFHVGDYFRREGLALAEPAFLDVVPIRFAIADVDAHYHVPLLCSPWSYTTYRGS